MPCCIIPNQMLHILKPFPWTSSLCMLLQCTMVKCHSLISFMICGCLITGVKKSENGGCKHEGLYHTAGHALSRVNLKKKTFNFWTSFKKSRYFKGYSLHCKMKWYLLTFHENNRNKTDVDRWWSLENIFYTCTNNVLIAMIIDVCYTSLWIHTAIMTLLLHDFEISSSLMDIYTF